MPIPTFLLFLFALLLLINALVEKIFTPFVINLLGIVAVGFVVLQTPTFLAKNNPAKRFFSGVIFGGAGFYLLKYQTGVPPFFGYCTIAIGLYWLILTFVRNQKG